MTKYSEQQTEDKSNHKEDGTQDNDSLSRDLDEDKEKLSVNRTSIAYDITMLILTCFDLLLISIDNILMSSSLQSFAEWLLREYEISSIGNILTIYNSSEFTYFNHNSYSMVGGAITLILISEILTRWGIAIIKKTHYRWFFFPFIHWYEVIGCFPQLRVLRLLRVIVIIKRLHQLGWQIIPEKWLKMGHFYYSMILEELSDRVLLTATANIKTQLSTSMDSQVLVKKTIDNNRENIESMILSMLRTELAPRLREELMPSNETSPISKHVGLAVSEAIDRTPEVRAVLSKIPIAGSIIKSQLMSISEKVGYNLAESISQRLLRDEVLDEVFVSIAHGISQIDTSNPALESLISDIMEEGLTAFEQQVKIQQWQHHEYMEKISI